MTYLNQHQKCIPTKFNTSQNVSQVRVKSPRTLECYVCNMWLKLKVYESLFLYIPQDIPGRVPEWQHSTQAHEPALLPHGAASACDQVPITAKSHQQGYQRMSPRLLPLKRGQKPCGVPSRTHQHEDQTGGNRHMVLALFPAWQPQEPRSH